MGIELFCPDPIEDILLDFKMREERQILRDIGDLSLFRGQVLDFPVIDPDLSLLGFMESHHRLEDQGLAGACWPEEEVEPFFFNFNGKIR